MHAQSKKYAKCGMLRKATFAAMPVLAAGLMLSCKNGGTSSSYSDAGPAYTYLPAIPAPKRIDANYPIGVITGCPEWMVRIPNTPRDYCIDRFEAYLLELKNGAWFPHPNSVSPRKKVIKAAVAPNVFPQSSINWYQANEACRNAGKRLCTLEEWKKACKGEQGFTYPYGNEEYPNIYRVEGRGKRITLIKKGKCNTGAPHLLSLLDGSDPKKWNMKDPWYNMAGYLAKTGAYPECVSSYGVYDMYGNLHEWVSTFVDEEMAASFSSSKRGGRPSPQGFQVKVGNGIFVGGWYSTRNENGKGCDYITNVHLPNQDDLSIGFRCCKDAE